MNEIFWEGKTVNVRAGKAMRLTVQHLKFTFNIHGPVCYCE